MIIRKAFRFRLCPTKQQLYTCVCFAGACRWVYNRGLAERKRAWEEDNRPIRLFEQNKELTRLKHAVETEWLKEIHSQILQQSLNDLDLAFEHFFRRTKNGAIPGYPRFKCRDEKDSFRYPQGVRVEGRRAWLPKIGWVRFRRSRAIEGKIKQTTVIKEGSHWYVCFSCEIERKELPSFDRNKVIGIDVGLENFATLAHDEGFEEIASPRFLNKDLLHLKYLGRQLSKKTKRSRNWRLAKAKLQNFHARVRYRRHNFLHQYSTRLVKNHDVVVVENLKVKQLLEKSPRSLARSIADAGWRQFLQMLQYKCEHTGKSLVEAGEYFPSTQLCSRCGCRNSICLATRYYSCGCGLSMHRDRNAALNLKAVGTTVSKACGAAL